MYCYINDLVKLSANWEVIAMKIVIFGIGQGLELVEKKIKKEHQIVGYTDSYSKINVFKGKPFYQLKDITKINFDQIIITIREREIALEIYNILIGYGICSNKILPFYNYANYELYNIKLRKHNLENIEGLIFGNSHAACGFLEEEILRPFLNFAIPSADLYFNYKVFDKCVTNYKVRLKKLQYIVIDMFDYVYFNYDTSLSAYMFNYICNGGLREEHNFKNNKNFQQSYDQIMIEKGYLTTKGDNEYEQLFTDMDVECGLCSMERWRHIDKKEPANVDVLIGSLISNKFEKTIEENLRIINRFVQEIQYNFPKVKVIFTLIPRYISMEKLGEVFIQPWKKEFYNIINILCKKYNTLFWDYKNLIEISMNHMFYYDVSHLNTTGGRALTSIFNENLKKV